MVKIIFTYRPLSWKPMSWINLITRIIQRYPRDHVAILRSATITESTFKVGTQKVLYSDWLKGREGTDAVIYHYPENQIDWDLLDKFRGKKYDTRAAIFHFLGLEEKLIKRKDKAVTCSEFVAIGLGMDEAWKALPKDVEYFLRGKGCVSVNEKLG